VRTARCRNCAGKLQVMEDPQATRTGPIPLASPDELVEALGVVVGDGLPIPEPSTAGILVSLKSVYARAVIPGEPMSRLHALNELLPRLIAGLSDSNYREGVQILFALSPGTRGTNLTARRRQCADLTGYNPGYFRGQIETKLLRAVAMTLHEDLLRYQSRTKRAISGLEPTGQTPSLGPEHMNHEEELISRIWQHVYGLRAESIASIRLEDSGLIDQAEMHRQQAEVLRSDLHDLIAEYASVYGDDLIRHGNVEFGLQALDRLTSWGDATHLRRP
jgi:hypothetical protein